MTNGVSVFNERKADFFFYRRREVVGLGVGRVGVDVNSNCRSRAAGAAHTVDDSCLIAQHYANALNEKWGSMKPRGSARGLWTALLT